MTFFLDLVYLELGVTVSELSSLADGTEYLLTRSQMTQQYYSAMTSRQKITISVPDIVVALWKVGSQAVVPSTWIIYLFLPLV